MIAISLLSCLVQQAAVVAPVAVQGDYGAEPGIETLFDASYPLGKGPLSLGYPPDSLPVVITLRGGNSNSLVPGSPGKGTLSAQAISFGVVGIDPNFPTVGESEDYQVSAAGVARLIQYLRFNAAELNLDPTRIFLAGRSFGQVVTHAVSLKQDYQDLASSDPVEWQSSRPNYAIARAGPTALPCFSKVTTGWGSAMSTFFFAGSDFSDATEEMRIQDSAFWWLTNPHLFQRTFTPPICMVYWLSDPDTCGEIIDVHSGYFGNVMWSALSDLAERTAEPGLMLASARIDNTTQPEPETITRIMIWVSERLADSSGGLWLLPPQGGVDSVAGSNFALPVLGVEPGATVTLYRGSAAGATPVAGCPGLALDVQSPVPLATAVADSTGLAVLVYHVAPAEIGAAVRLQAADAGGCEVSNVVQHTYF